MSTECNTLAERLSAKKAAGLRDVKFFMRNIDEVSPDVVCREVNALYDAVERGDSEPLDFGDVQPRK